MNEATTTLTRAGANAMLHDKEKGLEAGFFRYLTKPIKINEFLTALDEALEMSKTE